MPVQGMGAFNKLYVVRTISMFPPRPVESSQAGTEPANGYESTFPLRIESLRRVFVNSLVNGCPNTCGI